MPESIPASDGAFTCSRPESNSLALKQRQDLNRLRWRLSGVAGQASPAENLAANRHSRCNCAYYGSAACGRNAEGWMQVRSLVGSELISRIDELLEARYRSADLGNMDDPLDETIYILLSRQTREPVYMRVYRDLRRCYPRWSDVLEAPDESLASLLRPAGLHHQRARQVKALLAAVREENRRRAIGPAGKPPADLTLGFLRALSDEEAEQFLTRLPGIGPKSARCVLAYSLNRPAFAVDTHVHRVFSRLRLVTRAGRKKDHDRFQDAVPDRVRKRLHINLVHHGRAICRARRPKCGDCVLVSFCAEGRQAVANERRPAVVDLFAGAGGLGYGFRKAGFRVALAVESDRHAAQTYRLNNPGVPVIEAEIDVSTSAHQLTRFMPGVEQVMGLLAGPPCQGYSAAGARDPDAAGNLLYRQVASLAAELQVETVLLENVPGVRRVRGHGFLNDILQSLREAGYATDAHLVNACEFGVPQHRARYLFLGRRGEGASPPPGPDATHRSHGKGSATDLPDAPTLRSVLAPLPELPAGATGEPVPGPDGTEYFNVETMAHSERVVAKIKGIKPGEGPISYRRLRDDEARTLIAGHRALPVHPWLDRTISVREAATIQGFPHHYRFCGPRSDQPLQVANAVPPPLAEAVALHLMQVIREGRAPEDASGTVPTDADGAGPGQGSPASEAT